MSLLRAKYVGASGDYRGHYALLQKIDDEHVKVQFDDLSHPMSHGWYEFPSSDWQINHEDDDDGE